MPRLLYFGSKQSRIHGVVPWLFAHSHRPSAAKLGASRKRGENNNRLQPMSRSKSICSGPWPLRQRAVYTACSLELYLDLGRVYREFGNVVDVLGSHETAVPYFKRSAASFLAALKGGVSEIKPEDKAPRLVGEASRGSRKQMSRMRKRLRMNSLR